MPPKHYSIEEIGVMKDQDQKQLVEKNVAYKKLVEEKEAERVRQDVEKARQVNLPPTPPPSPHKAARDVSSSSHLPNATTTPTTNFQVPGIPTFAQISFTNP